MRNYNQHQYLIGIILFLLASCKSQEVTFTKVYEKELPEVPNRLASMSPDGSYIFGLEAVSKTGLGTPEAFVMNSSGEVVWFNKAKDLGEIERNPDNVMWVWEENKAIFFSRNSDFRISCIDLTSGEEIWSFQDESNKYSTNGFYVPTANGVMMQTPQGLSIYSIADGSVLWTREDIKIDNDIADFVFGSPESLDWRYLEEQDRLLVSSENNIELIDPATGKSSWSVTRAIGSLANADIFSSEGLAVFYGETDESLGKSLARSTELGGLAMDVAESGLIKEDMIVVDLKTGDRWEQKFMTNGNHQPVLKDDKLIMAGIVLNVYDRESGEVLWQNIDEDRFSADQLNKALGFLTGIDLTIGDRGKQEDLIFDNAIYAFYPEVLDKAVSESKISLRKYDIDSGEELWRTAPERVSVDRYFGAEGVLYLAGTVPGFVPRPVLIAYDAVNGEKLFEKKLKSSRYNDAIVENGRLYMLLFPWELRAFDARTGDEIAVDKPGRGAHDIRRLQNGLFVAYDRQLALHNKEDFSLKNQVEVPGYFDRYDYRGNTFFMHDLEGDPAKGVIAMDIEKFELKGYLLNKQQGSFQNKQGDNLVYKDYHLFLTDDGKYVYELDKDVIRKYAVE